MLRADTDKLVRTVTTRAARSNGIVDSAELIALGATYAWIEYQVEQGWLTPLFRGVYLVGQTMPSVVARWTAAVRSGGTGARLLGVSGAVHWEMLPRWRVPSVDDVFVVGRVSQRPGVRYRRVGWMTRHEERTLLGIPIGSPAAIVASLGLELSTHELVHLIDRGEFRDKHIARDLQRIVDRGPFHGRGRIVRALQHFRDGETGLASGFEFNIDRELERLGAPKALVNPLLLLPDGETLRVDRFYAEARLIAEADYSQHATERHRKTDLGRDARATLGQLETIRVASWIPPDERRARLEHVAARARKIVAGPSIQVVKRSSL